MSGSKGSSSSNTQSNQTDSTSIDPNVYSSLLANQAKAQQTLGNASYSPLSASQIQGYENPYTASVVNTTNQQLQQQNQIADTANNENATTQGAFGGDRASVLNALTNLGYAQTIGATDANLNAQGYQQATNTAQGENTAAQQYPLLLQQLLNQTLAVTAGNANRTGTASGTSSTQGSQSSMNSGNLGDDLLAFIGL